LQKVAADANNKKEYSFKYSLLFAKKQLPVGNFLLAFPILEFVFF